MQNFTDRVAEVTVTAHRVLACITEHANATALKNVSAAQAMRLTLIVEAGALEGQSLVLHHTERDSFREEQFTDTLDRALEELKLFRGAEPIRGAVSARNAVEEVIRQARSLLQASARLDVVTP